MASELARINDELRRAYDGDAWHGPPLLEVLKGVSANLAAAKVQGISHSIWELVNHLTVWLDIVARRTLEPKPVADAGTDDFSPVGQASESAWQATRIALASKHTRLLEVVATLDDYRLDELVPGKNYPVAVMLHGTAQHYAYHAGQIALLKRLTETIPAPSNVP